MIIAGYSAGSNLAAITAQRVRDEGGPALAGQVLYVPVTDYNPDSPSLTENAEGYFLTAALMEWFWDFYVPNVSDRTDPKASPIRAASLAELPPAFIMTCEFDPLRDEGEAYAAALNEAGTKATLQRMDGHIHTSVPAVDVLPSGGIGPRGPRECHERFPGNLLIELTESSGHVVSGRNIGPE